MLFSRNHNSAVTISTDAVITEINLLYPTNCSFVLTTIWTKQKAIFYYELNILYVCDESDTVASFSARVEQLSQSAANKKHLKHVGPIRDCELPHAHSPGVATGTVARRLRIDVHDDNDNA